MGNLDTSLTVSFNENETETEAEEAPSDLLKNYSFILEEDRGGADLFHPASAYVNVINGLKSIVKESGVANVRLYTAVTPNVKIYGTYGGNIIYLGQRSDMIREVITFSGSSSQTTSKGYGIASATIISKTPFYNKDGYGASSPTQKESGMFVANEEVYGALMVEYLSVYRLYRVSYQLPDNVLTDMINSGKTLSQYKLFPITVLATAIGGYGATLNISRNIRSDVELSECSGHWIEDERKTKKVKVYDPDDLDGDGNPIPGANYIEIERMYELIERCSNNSEVKRTIKFNVEA